MVVDGFKEIVPWVDHYKFNGNVVKFSGFSFRLLLSARFSDVPYDVD